MCWEPVSARTCGVKHNCEQDLQDECASISLFWHFRGDPARDFSTRDMANASLEMLLFFFSVMGFTFCFLTFVLFSLVCFVWFFYPVLPTVELRVYCTSICSLSAHPTVMQGCNTLVSKKRKDGSEVLALLLRDW